MRTKKGPYVTDQEIDISLLLPGPCCGRYVPEPDEIEWVLAEVGIERTDQHPEFTLEPEEEFEYEEREFEGTNFDSIVLLQGMGNRLELPRGTPRHFPPYPGATQRWSERTRQQVRRIRRKAPGIVCATYRNHGRTGQTWGVDIMVAPFKQKANAPQKDLGNALVRWLMNNWVEMHLNYVIWWNWMNDGAGWFDYSPWSKPASQGGFPGGSPDMNTRRHEDHVHIQVMNPNRGPNQ
jgi:hypothetical protein